MHTPVSHLVLAAAETALGMAVALFFMTVAGAPVSRCARTWIPVVLYSLFQFNGERSFTVGIDDHSPRRKVHETLQSCERQTMAGKHLQKTVLFHIAYKSTA
jgi:hypothetical protein